VIIKGETQKQGSRKTSTEKEFKGRYWKNNK
jgi:hypothetical protein